MCSVECESDSRCPIRVGGEEAGKEEGSAPENRFENRSIEQQTLSGHYSDVDDGRYGQGDRLL
jgi:hypothetical protein